MSVSKDGSLAVLTVRLSPSVNATYFKHDIESFQVWMKTGISEWQELKVYRRHCVDLSEPLSTASEVKSTPSLSFLSSSHSSYSPAVGSKLTLEAILPVERYDKALCAFKVVSVMSEDLSLPSNEVESEVIEIRKFSFIA